MSVDIIYETITTWPRELCQLVYEYTKMRCIYTIECDEKMLKFMNKYNNHICRDNHILFPYDCGNILYSLVNGEIIKKNYNARICSIIGKDNVIFDPANNDAFAYENGVSLPHNYHDEHKEYHAGLHSFLSKNNTVIYAYMSTLYLVQNNTIKAQLHIPISMHLASLAFSDWVYNLYVINNHVAITIGSHMFITIKSIDELIKSIDESISNEYIKTNFITFDFGRIVDVKQINQKMMIVQDIYPEIHFINTEKWRVFKRLEDARYVGVDKNADMIVRFDKKLVKIHPNKHIGTILECKENERRLYSEFYMSRSCQLWENEVYYYLTATLYGDKLYKIEGNIIGQLSDDTIVTFDKKTSEIKIWM